MDLRLLWDFSDPEGSRDKFLELLIKTDRPLDLEIRAQIARTYSLQKETDLAHRFLDRLEAEPDLKSFDRAYGCYLLERGRTFNTEGNKEKARELFELATKVEDDEILVDALHMFGFIETPSVALEFNRKALKIALNSENPMTRRWAGTLYNNSGWALFDMGRADEALIEFQSALAEREQHGTRIDEAKWCLARCLRALGRFEQALAMLDSMAVNDEHAMEERKLNRARKS